MKNHIRGLMILLFSLLSAVAIAETQEHQLFIVHFSTGSAWNEALPPGEQTGFSEHSANLRRLRKEGVILFGARYGELGMIIIREQSIDKARAILEADPGIRAGIFEFKLEPASVFYKWRDSQDS